MIPFALAMVSCLIGSSYQTSPLFIHQQVNDLDTPLLDFNKPVFVHAVKFFEKRRKNSGTRYTNHTPHRTILYRFLTRGNHQR